MVKLSSLRKQFERFKKTEDFRKIYEDLWIEQDGRCYWCDCELIRLDKTKIWIDEMFKKQATIDHIKSLSGGGLNTKDNLVLSCLSCNARKGTKNV